MNPCELELLKNRYDSVQGLLDPRYDIPAGEQGKQQCFKMPSRGPIDEKLKKALKEYWKREEEEVVRDYRDAYETTAHAERGPGGCYTGKILLQPKRGGWRRSRRKVSRRKNRKRTKRKRTKRKKQ